LRSTLIPISINKASVNRIPIATPRHPFENLSIPIDSCHSAFESWSEQQCSRQVFLSRGICWQKRCRLCGRFRCRWLEKFQFFPWLILLSQNFKCFAQW
jgi:hypothetical protein